MQVQAVHPSYINMIGTDRYAPDWSSCEFSHDYSGFVEQTRRLTFWETPDFWLTGYTFPAKAFWRAPTVPVRVGDRVEKGFHLVQFWMNYRQRAEEIMVFYPPDGYWRARPLPFEEMRWTAYGSSFLIGPVEIQQRPIVRSRGNRLRAGDPNLRAEIQTRRHGPDQTGQDRPGTHRARRFLQRRDARRAAVRLAAVDVSRCKR